MAISAMLLTGSAPIMIFTAMIIYVTTVEFSLAPRRPPSPTLLAPVGK
jgi:hypothetical protein